MPVDTIERFPVGSLVRTPSGRTARVIKHSSGYSKKDLLERIYLKYTDARDGECNQVVLPPYMLLPAGMDAK